MGVYCEAGIRHARGDGSLDLLDGGDKLFIVQPELFGAHLLAGCRLW